jgi:plastocyanin
MSERFTFSMLVLAAVCGAAVLGASQHVITQKGKAFSTASLTMQPGDELVFKNDDDVTHNLFTNTKGFEFNLTQKPGDSSSQSFKTEGVAEIRCAFHPRMKMTVTVKK